MACLLLFKMPGNVEPRLDKGVEGYSSIHKIIYFCTKALILGSCIMITHPCNFYPLATHFGKVKVCKDQELK